MTNTPSPIADTYWVIPGRFMAGRNPLAMPGVIDEKNIKAMLACGIDTFIDLTHKDEFGGVAYAPILEKYQHEKEYQYFNHPIVDFGLPTQTEMSAILRRIHRALKEGCNIYLHCYAGLGRTGTVVGCFLVERGLTGREALAEIIRMRSDLDGGGQFSPQTGEQKQFVMNWKKG
ncbi:MAG: hypothetical protein C0391_06825 [Anaerolinea sp.]|nr:hypothetical protein [Anaerolinea sp.]